MFIRVLIGNLKSTNLTVKVTEKEGKNIDFLVGKILIYLLNINLQALNKM